MEDKRREAVLAATEALTNARAEAERKKSKRRKVILVLGIFCPLIWIGYFFVKYVQEEAKRNPSDEKVSVSKPSTLLREEGNKNIYEPQKKEVLFRGGDGNLYSTNSDMFCDFKGNYVRWGSPFLDSRGNWCEVGSPFYDGKDNWCAWGAPFYDSKGNLIFP